MTSITLTEREPILTAVAGARIPRRAFADVAELARLLEEAGGVMLAAERRAGLLLEQARAEGFAAGAAFAQAQMVRHLLEAQRQARQFLDRSQERIVALAVSIIERIAPSLNQPELVAALAAEALRAVQAERHLRIRVCASAADATREMLTQWHAGHPEIETAQVSIDPHAAPFTCIIESELGRIEAGLPAQLESVREQLAAVARERQS
ncbi:MAG TPA: FliH/SctL family protein [Steroidobacteraceae bacterium]|jgi:type III secretion protein L